MEKLLSRFQGQSSSGSPQLKFVISEKEQYLLSCRDNFKLKLLSHFELDMFLEMEALTLCKFSNSLIIHEAGTKKISLTFSQNTGSFGEYV